MNASLQDFQAQIAAARAQKRVLRIRGGGSKDFYGNRLKDHDILEMRSYQGIVDYDPSELVVTARAGTPLAQLETLLAQHQQYLPFEPPHFESSHTAPQTTVGGMLAAGLSGASRAARGSVRDHVLGVQIINGAGQVLRFGGTVMKNVAGYDLSRLMVGSLGTLAAVTEISLKVMPIPQADITLMCHINQTNALRLMNQWRAQPLPIYSTAWLCDPTFDPPQDCLFVRLRGALGALQSALRLIEQDIHAAGACVVYIDREYAAKDWQAASGHHLHFFTHPPSSQHALWRLSVPPAAPALDVPHPTYIEWQGAQRWLWAKASERHALQTIASKVGGHATLFRASQAHPEQDKHLPVFQPLSESLAKINRALSLQLDPHQVFATERM